MMTSHLAERAWASESFRKAAQCQASSATCGAYGVPLQGGTFRVSLLEYTFDFFPITTTTTSNTDCHGPRD